MKNKSLKSNIRALISQSEVALSHQALQHELKDACNRVTIYRILDKLVEEGSIHRIIDTNGVSKFAACQDCTTEHKDDHIHFSCTQCQSVTCLDEVIPSFKMPKDYFIEAMNFTLSGLCPNCQN